ncbi:MAG: hypothetical protein IJN03_00340, partial [Bacilli bacterium]|nr:hypothetical protein [Bacilli bacterium]
SIVAVLLVIIGVTYAYWLVTKTQTNQNVISSGCLDISLTGEKNDIELQDQFPLSDEDGMKLIPYEFTVTNNCNTSVDYQVNLESLGTESEAIISTALKVALDSNVKLLSSGGSAEPTVTDAYESHSIAAGRLAAASTTSDEDTVTYKLRIWIDEDAPISEQNKTYTGKISVTVGQGVVVPYEKGTLAYNILSNYGGIKAMESISTDHLVEAITETANYHISISSNYYYATEATYDEEAGKYTLSGTLVQATTTECQNGTKECGKYTLMNASPIYSSETLYEVIDFKSSGTSVIVNKMQYTTEFGKGTIASEAGVYKTQDDSGDSYYFRGDVKNNYVKFGTYAKDAVLKKCTGNNTVDCSASTNFEILAGSPMYWRIIRINGDGTIRMIYDGTEPVENGTPHVAAIDALSQNYSSVYPDNVNNVTYLDELQTSVDNWYTNYLQTNYEQYIADSIFCEDKESISAGTLEYNTRIFVEHKPKLTCTQEEGKLTVANGKLINPIGLITLDEAIMAGISTFNYNTSSNNYLYSGTPYSTISNIGYAEYIISGNSGIYSTDLYYDHEVRPVINIKSDILFNGSGTIDDPYVLAS